MVERGASHDDDHTRIAALVLEVDAERVVVGLPLSLDGRHGPAAQAATEEAARLAERLPVPVDLYDERLTTVTASRALRERGTKGRKQRAVIDQTAAAVMLQSWLDGQR
jgi:putative Holliday junction resolvase